MSRAANTARSAKAIAAAYSSDDRETIGLLALPFFLMAFAIAFSQANRTMPPLGDVIASRPAVDFTVPKPAALSPAEARHTAIAAKPAEPLEPAVVARAPEIVERPASQALEPQAPATMTPAPGTPTENAEAAPAPSTELQAKAQNGSPAAVPPAVEMAERVSPDNAIPAGTAAEVLPQASPANVAETAMDTAKADPGRIEIAALNPAEPIIAIQPPVTEVAPPPAPTENFCRADASANLKPKTVLGSLVPSSNPDAFGLALASAAREQLDDFIIYTDKYYNISYPLGDIPALYGVCTDVIVRAYRAVGYDLQRLVQETRSGAGDKNIDHRRVDTLRKFFGKYGDNLPITEFGEDYKPGDIVSYYRPQNRHSRTHIAIVSDMIGPSGRPMIIHNRGWGPQQEDALFVDQITGHYRFTGAKMPAPPAAPAIAGRPPKASAAQMPSAAPAAKGSPSRMIRASYGAAPAAQKSKITAR